ncbi:unnamed protein product [Effrenium voratum]|uniref:Kinesin-like protein n=1 Tax=Effrenium voratum TaxID=2562239 RepID=A0AA36IX00_9DINO|nr:unnamed protein product [Effrenium voratum]
MVGYGANKGIVPISCEEIFKRICANTDANLTYEVMVSMVEIYNEQVQDLLVSPRERPKKGLEIRESQQLGIYIAGVCRRPVDSYSSIEAVVDEGTENRTVGSTLMNATSSRAHTVLTIEFKQVSQAAGQQGQKLSLINLVDLAGSEKAGQTGASGDRLKEGCAINKSLSALGNVIEKLADKAMGKAKAGAIIPYRDSKLTRLLQNALGGSSKTVMICAVSPASSNYEETLSTLRYADRAKRIKNTASINENPQELGVEPDIDHGLLKKVLRKKAVQVHPDKHPKEEQQEWTERFQHFEQIMETLQDEKSRRVYDEIHLKLERTARILILMDMNGSLLCKLGKDGKDGHPGRDAGRPDFEDRNNRFWVRPHAAEFLEAVLDPKSKIAFAIYTSRQLRNAQPQVDSLFQSLGLRGLQRNLFAIFAGDDFSVPDPQAGPHKSKRSLPRIWQDHRTCAARGVKFDICNTVNLDNEASKLREHMENGIIVPSFAPAQLGKEDKALLSLKDYLTCLAKECHGDVREYMKLFPFGQSFMHRGLPPMSAFEEDEVAELTVRFSKVDLAGYAAASEPEKKKSPKPDKLIRQLREENEKLRNMVGGGSPTQGGEGQSAEEMSQKHAEIAALEQALQEMQKSFAERLAEEKKAHTKKEKTSDIKLPHIANLNEDLLLTAKLKFAFKEGLTRIGRGSQEDGDPNAPEVALQVPGIHQEHATVENSNGAVKLKAMDPEAASTTFVNGTALQAGNAVTLSHGDRLAFGQCIFVFVEPLKGKVAELINSGQVTYAAARKELQHGEVPGPTEEELKASKERAEELERKAREAEDAKEKAKAEAEALMRQRENEFKEQMELKQKQWEQEIAQQKAAEASEQAAAAEQARVHAEARAGELLRKKGG